MATGATLRLTYSTSSGNEDVINFKYVDTGANAASIIAFSDGLVARKALFMSPFSEVTALTKAEIYQTLVQNVPLS